MITITTGNLLNSKAEALVNTVNCVGVMGRGIALQFKKAFPENFAGYKKVCDQKKLVPGELYIFEQRTLTGEQRYIINFPTKRHWKGNSKLEDIQIGLKTLVDEITRLKIKSIAIPPLGCGLGGLDWDVVRAEIEKAFINVSDVHVYLYEPKGAPAPTTMVNHTKRPRMTKGRAALLKLMKQYFCGLMAPSVSLLEIQKLMYFMQIAGEDLRLNFVKGPYGPYAENLRHVLSLIEGHFIDGYGDGGDDPKKSIEYRSDASQQADQFLMKHQSTLQNVERVSSLIEGFENAYGMELLATVHWVVVEHSPSSMKELVLQVGRWNSRKAKELKPSHIEIAYKMLLAKGWVAPFSQ